jgi:ribosomal protein L12E/L44/L45/RPP1/RPP2
VTKFVRAPFCSPALARNICLETFLENGCNVLVVTVLSSWYGAAAQCRTQVEEEEEEEEEEREEEEEEEEE